MTCRVGYFIRANEAIYNFIRRNLPAGCELVTLAPGTTPIELLPDLDILIAGHVSRQMISVATRLKLIMTPGCGSDGVDLLAAQESSIPVAITNVGNTDEVAEHTLMLMLAVSRRLTELDASLRQGKWLMWDRRLQSFSLAGKTLGLVGFGRIGQAVAERAQAFRMKTQYYDIVHQPDGAGIGLDDLLVSSDYVSLHVPLTSSTRHLLDARRIGAMKQGAILINAARGEAVDEPALVRALQEGHLAGAGLDVFEKEPPDPANPLFSMPNVVVTPHVASGTADSLRVKAAHYAENVRRVRAGQSAIGVLQQNG